MKDSEVSVIAHKFGNSGPRLLILGRIHGNEPCGTIGIERVGARLQSGDMKLSSGCLTLVPVCNPRAADANQRLIDVNLNRFMEVKETPRYYEERLMNELCPMLQDCDVLLDIHSYTAGGAPFALRGPDNSGKRELEEALVKATGTEIMFHDFAGAYKASGQAYDPVAATGTTEYARRYGAYGITLECGQHDDPASADHAERAIYGVLLHFGMIDAVQVPEHLRPTPPKKLQSLRMAYVQYREHDGVFVHAWKQMDMIKAGTVIARYADGRDVVAPIDGVMVMPHATTPVHTEWFYLAQEDK
jgi:uncharacterized protein